MERVGYTQTLTESLWGRKAISNKPSAKKKRNQGRIEKITTAAKWHDLLNQWNHSYCGAMILCNHTSERCTKPKNLQILRVHTISLRFHFSINNHYKVVTLPPLTTTFTCPTVSYTLVFPLLKALDNTIWDLKTFALSKTLPKTFLQNQYFPRLWKLKETIMFRLASPCSCSAY